jgi:putative transposase
MVQRKINHSRVISSTQGSLSDIEPKKWERIALIDALVRPTLEQEFGKIQAQEIAARLQIHWTTVYRYRRRLLDLDLASAVVGRSPGFPTGSTRLSVAQKSIVDQVIERLSRKLKKIRVVDVCDEVARRCRIDGILMPSRSSIDRCLRRTVPTLVIRRNEETDRQITAAAGNYSVSKALDVVQIDHTKCDIDVVDNLYRLPIGRPWLSVAMDIATRAIVAILVTFEPPSATTVGLLISRIAHDKSTWIKSLGLEIDWPMAGLPRSLHLDNATEFHSKALSRGCTQFGIELIYRPIGRPQFGGHIERVIGTLMNKLKSLPGATGHSVKNRKHFAPEKTAALTLSEFELWLALEIGERYHHTEHHGLKGGTPYAAWQVAAPLVRPVKRPNEVFIAFLPAIRRTLQRSGILFNHIRYWNPILTPWLAQKTAVTAHYDPANLSVLHVELPDKSIITVGYADLRHPAVALWEVVATLKHLRTINRETINEARLFKAINAQRAIIDGALSKTRAARKATARKQSEQSSRSSLSVENNDKKNGVKTSVDYGTQAPDYAAELWSHLK